MGEKVEFEGGSDWCTLKIAKYCPGKVGIPAPCILLDGQVRICDPCLQDLNDDEEWTLKGTSHEGSCKRVTADVGNEEVTFCPGCLRKVLLSQDPAALDWVLSYHDENHHTEPKGGLDDTELSLRACRDCLLLALWKVDPTFFSLVTTVRGKALVESFEEGRYFGRSS